MAKIDSPAKINDVKSSKNFSSSAKYFFYQKLFFEEFLPRLPDQFIIFNKTIPFHTIRIILGSFRYTKWDIREIVKKWVSLGLVEYSKFRGIKLLRR